MSYGLATHGDWCHTRTYPTRCRYCGESVFYFQCDHGCKVFFDKLGPPWPEHRCLEYLKAMYGAELIAYGLATMMMTPGVDVGKKIDKQYAKKVQQQQIAVPQPQIVRCDPCKGVTVQQEGVVRELTEDVDVYKRFDIPERSLGASLLGSLARDKYAQITIHTGALGVQDNLSYTFFVQQSLVDRLRIAIGDFVVCRLNALTILNRNAVWVCELLGQVPN